MGIQGPAVCTRPRSDGVGPSLSPSRWTLCRHPELRHRFDCEVVRLIELESVLDVGLVEQTDYLLVGRDVYASIPGGTCFFLKPNPRVAEYSSSGSGFTKISQFYVQNKGSNIQLEHYLRQKVVKRQGQFSDNGCRPTGPLGLSGRLCRRTRSHVLALPGKPWVPAWRGRAVIPMTASITDDCRPVESANPSDDPRVELASNPGDGGAPP